MHTTEKCTHYLVPSTHAEQLRALAKRSRVDQSVHLRNAVRALLGRYGDVLPPTSWPATPEGDALVNLVFRLPDEHLEGLKALETRTRIRRSEWFRRGLAEYLAEHTETPCACGCPQTFRQPRNGGPRLYFSDACARAMAKLREAGVAP